MLFWVKVRVIEPGHRVLAPSMAGLGILSLIHRDYAMDWQPVPAWVPWRPVLASASGALLLLSGVGLLLRRFATNSALVHRFSWTAFCVSAALSGCAWVIAHSIPASR
jgi:hypothetical protein